MSGTLASLGIGLGTALGAGLAGAIAGRKGRRERELENLYYAQLTDYAGRARDLENEYLEGLRSFDPSAALRQYAMGTYGEFSRQLGRALEQLRGQAVGAGRLDTGFYDADQGRLITDLASRYQDLLAARAMEAAEMDFRKRQLLGARAAEFANRYMDLLAGGLDRETAARAARAQLWAGALGAGARVAGMGLGS
ncbi:MAG: hypothetical protein ONB52_21865 [candidate division KSB1 bacterium]|nr:hypothetical protein [candidate division KSB1 bacterium]